MTAEEKYEKAFPWIRWRTSLRVGLIGGSVSMYGCRYCIAMKGLKGSEIENECFKSE